jgi:hypothetical protein
MKRNIDSYLEGSEGVDLFCCAETQVDTLTSHFGEQLSAPVLLSAVLPDVAKTSVNYDPDADME